MTLTTMEFLRLVEISIKLECRRTDDITAGIQLGEILSDISYRNDAEFRSILVMEKEKQKE